MTSAAYSFSAIGPKLDALWLQWRWVVLAFAIALRLLILYYDDVVTGPDQGFQMAATQSLLEGRGVTLTVFDLADVSESRLYDLTWWPPLYSYISAPLLVITGDFVTVLALTAWASAVIMYVAWFFILEQLDPLVRPATRAIIWAYWIFISPIGSQSPYFGATDHLSMALFTVAIALALRVVRQPQTPLWPSLAGAAALGIGASLRYSMIPLIAVIPMTHIGLMLFQRRTFALKHLAAYVLIPAAIVAVLSLPTYFNDASNNPAALARSARAVMDVVNKASPFPIIAFGVRVRWFVHTPETALLWVLSAGVLVMIGAVFVRWLRAYTPNRARQDGDAGAMTFFLCSGALTALATFAFLGYLTSRQPIDYVRTLVENTRYYIPAFPFISAVLIYGLVQREIRPRLLHYAGIGLFAVILLFATTGERRTFAYRFVQEPYGIVRDVSDPYWHYYETIRDLKARGTDVVFLSNYQPNAIKAWASLAGASIYDSIDSAPIDRAIRTSRPVTVVAMLWEGETMTEDDLLQRDRLLEFLATGTATLNHKFEDGRGAFEEYIVEIPPS